MNIPEYVTCLCENCTLQCTVLSLQFVDKILAILIIRNVKKSIRHMVNLFDLLSLSLKDVFNS